MTYGNQQSDGASRQESNMFFAFSNGIFHIVDEQARLTRSMSLGLLPTITRTIIFLHSPLYMPVPGTNPKSTNLFRNWYIKISLPRNSVLLNDGQV